MTMNVTNFTVADQLDFSGFGHVFVAIGVAHLLLVTVPSLILGPLILGLFISSKKLRDPVAILFMCITVVSIIGPLTYGLFQDLGLITDFPLLGVCQIIRSCPFWSSLGFSHLVLSTTSAILVVVQYVTVRWGRKLSIRGTILILIAFLPLLFLVSIINWNTLSDANAVIITVRGSLCYGLLTSISLNTFLVQGLLVFSVIAVAYITVLVFSILIVRYVKKHTIDNKKVVRDVLIVMIALSTSVVIFRLIPVLRFLIEPSFGDIIENFSIFFVLDYSIDFSYPLFLVLTLFVHKTVRTTFFKALKCSNVKKVFGKPSNRVLNSANI